MTSGTASRRPLWRGIRSRSTSTAPGFEKKAMSRYAATTPRLARWFKSHNDGRPYREQVRPFGFLNAFLAKSRGSWACPRTPSRRAPWLPTTTTRRVPGHCFDRETGESVDPEQLKSYRQALAQYHLHPEAKFLGGDYVDTGELQRRHIEVAYVEHIGKEANRWEEQFHLGEDPQAQVVYGQSGRQEARLSREVRKSIRASGRAAGTAERAFRGAGFTALPRQGTSDSQDSVRTSLPRGRAGVHRLDCCPAILAPTMVDRGGFVESTSASVSTHSVDVYAACARAALEHVPMTPRSANDKEYFPQDWLIDRFEEVGIPFVQQGRNGYPDFWAGGMSSPPIEGFEVKSLAFANGRPAQKDLDCNSTIPSGRKLDRDIFLAFFLYTGGGANPRPVHSLSIAHVDLVNSDYAVADAHANVAIHRFGSYGDGFIRNRKMYVFPHPAEH